MGRVRKRYDGAIKAKVALQAMRRERTTAEIASDFGIHPNLVTLWKKQALEALPASVLSEFLCKWDYDFTSGHGPRT